MQDRLLVWPLVLPRSGISEVLVVALRFPVSRLEFLAEMAAAGFAAVKRIEAEQLREFHEVPHPAGVFEVLVQFAIFAGHINAFPEFGAQFRDSVQRLFEPCFISGHAALFPEQLSQFAVK